MIVYDFKCAQGHVTEAWFGNSEAFDFQKEAGLLTCPVCGSNEIEKAPMAAAVHGTGNDSKTSRSTTSDQEQAQVEAWAKELAGCEYVGRDFVEQVRSGNAGNIYGLVSREEAEAMIDEGFAIRPVAAVPPPKERRRDLN